MIPGAADVRIQMKISEQLLAVSEKNVPLLMLNNANFQSKVGCRTPSLWSLAHSLFPDSSKENTLVNSLHHLVHESTGYIPISGIWVLHTEVSGGSG